MMSVFSDHIFKPKHRSLIPAASLVLTVSVTPFLQLDISEK